MKILGRIVVVLLIIIVSGFAFIYFAPGYNAYLVRSGSMTPAIGAGDLVITIPPDNPFGRSVVPGSIVTYARNGQVITHRVLEVDGDVLVTKGDAVEDPDPWRVRPSDVQGVYLMRFPSLGYMSNFVRTRSGWLVAVIAPAVVVICLIFREIRKELIKKREANFSK